MWFGFSFVFFVGLIYWSLGLRSSWMHKQHIHVLMTVLVTLKVLTMLVDGIKLNYMAREGTGSGWDYIWFVLYGVKGATLFIVIVLIGSGWSFVKPFLSERDKRIVMIILPLQVVNNIALVVTEEENQGNQDWAAWRDILHLFDIICCCAILFPIVWSIKHLREAAATDGKAAVNAEKLTLFRQFYMVRARCLLPSLPSGRFFSGGQDGFVSGQEEECTTWLILAGTTLSPLRKRHSQRRRFRFAMVCLRACA